MNMGAKTLPPCSFGKHDVQKNLVYAEIEHLKRNIFIVAINLDKKVADKKKKGSSPSAKQEPDEGKVTSAQMLILPRTT
jgi:hypothetical protein